MAATTLHPLSWHWRPLRFASAQPQPLPTPPPALGPVPVPDPDPGHKPHLPAWAAGLLLLVGIGAGLGLYQASKAGGTDRPVAAEPAAVPVVPVETKRFTKSIRIGGTVGAMDFAMIRAPSMRGGRDRGGGSSLTVQALAEPGSIVQKGDVVAEFESKRTQDSLETYESALAQTKAMVGTRKAEMLIATETLRQNYRSTHSEAEKASLDFQTAEVRSAIQAEILDLLAQEGRASSLQLESEVKRQEQADAAESRSLDISIEQDRKRMERTQIDLEKMRIRTPVSGLVVIETMFSRGNFQQAAAGDQLYPGAYFMRVVDLSQMAVFANVNQADSQLVQLGAPVQVRLDAYPEVVFEGRVASVGAMAVSGSGGGGRRGPPGSRGSSGQWIKQVPVEIEISVTDERIKPDLSASADVIVEELERALVIPRAAIETSPEGHVVWVQEDDGLVEREVELGSVSDTEAVVLSGLEDGELIASQRIVRNTELASR